MPSFLVNEILSGRLVSVFGKFDLAKDFLLFITIQIIGNYYAEPPGTENLSAVDFLAQFFFRISCVLDHVNKVCVWR